MKTFANLLVILLLICTSCNVEQQKFTRSEFLIMNNSSSEIEIYSSAMVSYHDGPQEGHFHDRIPVNGIQSLRIIGVSDSFDIENVFTKLEIYKGSVKSHQPVWNKDQWIRKDSANVTTFTLVVDSTFF